jgi:hypothetical protein
MLVRYNTESVPSSQGSSWMGPSGLLNPAKDNNDDHYIPDLPTPMSSSRAKVATIQRRPISAMFHPHHLPSDYPDPTNQQSMSEYNEDFRYNVPLEERYYHEKISRVQEL